MAEVAGEIMARNNLRGDMIDWLVPHQANKRIIEVDGRAHGPADGPRDGDDPQIRQHHQRDDPALPVGLRSRSSSAGDKLVLAAFGGGFTWAGAYVHVGL